MIGIIYLVAGAVVFTLVVTVDAIWITMLIGLFQGRSLDIPMQMLAVVAAISVCSNAIGKMVFNTMRTMR